MDIKQYNILVRGADYCITDYFTTKTNTLDKIFITKSTSQ